MKSACIILFVYRQSRVCKQKRDTSNMHNISIPAFFSHNERRLNRFHTHMKTILAVNLVLAFLYPKCRSHKIHTRQFWCRYIRYLYLIKDAPLFTFFGALHRSGTEIPTTFFSLCIDKGRIPLKTLDNPKYIHLGRPWRIHRQWRDIRTDICHGKDRQNLYIYIYIKLDTY